MPNRIKAAAERVKIGDGNQTVALYRETVRAMQDRLIELGFLRARPTVPSVPAPRPRSRSFQKAASLAPPASPIPGPCWASSTAARVRKARPSAGTPPASSRARRPGGTAPAGQPPAKLDLNLGGPTLQ